MGHVKPDHVPLTCECGKSLTRPYSLRYNGTMVPEVPKVSTELQRLNKALLVEGCPSFRAKAKEGGHPMS